MNDYYSVEQWTIIKSIEVESLSQFVGGCISMSYSIGNDFYVKRDVKNDIDRHYFHYVVLEECFNHYMKHGKMAMKTGF